MVNTKELCDYLKVHYNTVYKLVEEGMPYYDIGKGYRYKIEEVDAWLEKNKKTDKK